MAYEIRVNHDHIWFEPIVSAELADVTTGKEADWATVGAVLQQFIVTPRAAQWSIRRALLALRLRVLMWVLMATSVLMMLVSLVGLMYETAEVEMTLREANNLPDLEHGMCVAAVNKAMAKAGRISLRHLAYSTMATVGFTIIVTAITAWLCRWSERKLRMIVFAAVDEHLSPALQPERYTLLDVSLLYNPTLSYVSKVQNLTVASTNGTEELRLLLSSYISFTRRPGIVLFRMFVTSPEVLQSKAFLDSAGHILQHMDHTLKEQKLKILYFLRTTQQTLLCWEVFQQMDELRSVRQDLQLLLTRNQWDAAASVGATFEAVARGVQDRIIEEQPGDQQEVDSDDDDGTGGSFVVSRLASDYQRGVG